MSIAKVAELAGLSQATVSRVINHEPSVSSRSVRAVAAAMMQLGYTPPTRRRGPKKRTGQQVRTGNVAVLMFDEDPTLVQAPVTAAVTHAINEALHEAGFNMILAHSPAHAGLPPLVAAGEVDGLLLHGSPPPRDLALRLQRFPCVWLLSPRGHRGYWADRVEPDNAQIGRLAADVLIGHGHTRLATLYAHPTHLGFHARCEGFIAGAREAGLDANLAVDDTDAGPRRVSPSELAQAIGRLVDRLLALAPRPTGWFVPRDQLTVLVHHALRARGLEPGRDIELVSCDNEMILQGLDPRPTTIDIRPDELGRQAVDRLLWRIAHPQAPMHARICIEPRIVWAPGSAADAILSPSPPNTDAN